MKNNFKEIIRKLLMVVAIVTIIYSGYNLLNIKEEENLEKTVNKDIIEVIGDDESGEVKFLTKETFKKLEAINSDFVGYLYYPSLNINEQVVHGSNNEYYLNHSFNKEYLPYGTVFVDANQQLFQQNTTLYGHWVSNSTLKFSNLHKLKDVNNYEANKTYYFASEDYIYEYEVAIVIYHHSVDDYDSIPYWHGNFSEIEFKNFINNAKSQQFYDTGVEITSEDKILTLQTCITADSEERLVVIGKLVNKITLEDN